MPYKVAITGRFRRGKNTVADILTEHFGPGTTQLAFADALKAEFAEVICNAVHNSDPLESWETWMKDRRDISSTGWQFWGEFCRHYYDEDYWIDHPRFQHRYTQAVASGYSVLITDMRHHNEAKWAKDNGFFRVRIDGPCRAAGETRDPNHASERFIDELEVDYVLYNTSSLEMLRRNVLTWLVPTLKRAQLPVAADANLTS